MTRKARLNLSVIGGLFILLAVLAFALYPKVNARHAGAATSTERPWQALSVRRKGGTTSPPSTTSAHAKKAIASVGTTRARIERLEELQRTPEQDRVLWNAEEQLVGDCMKERGFDYQPSPPDRRAAEEVAYTRVPRGDTDAARAVGYGLHLGLLQGEQPKQEIDANAEQLAAMPPARQAAFREALLGPPVNPTEPEMAPLVDSIPMPDGSGALHFYRDACVARARRELYGTDYEHNEAGFARQTLRKELDRAVESDAAYGSSVKSWSDCMRARGLSYAHPREPKLELMEQLRTGALDAESLQHRELEVASADAACDQASALEVTREAAKARAEKTLTHAQQEKLQKMRAEQELTMSRALSALEGEDE